MGMAQHWTVSDLGHQGGDLFARDLRERFASPTLEARLRLISRSTSLGLALLANMASDEDLHQLAEGLAGLLGGPGRAFSSALGSRPSAACLRPTPAPWLAPPSS